MAQAMGFKLVGYDPYLQAEQLAEHGIQCCTLEKLIGISDIVTLHVPLSDTTRGLVGERQLSQMKPTAYLVNTSRGDVVDEKALVKALKGGKIAGAALDVTSVEPMPLDHPFLSMDQVILTPHIAFYSDLSIHDVKARTALYVLRALVNEGDYCLANPKVVSE